MKKFILFLFTLVIGLAVFCGIKTKATGIALSMEDGAQVRTEGLYQGLRFEAEVDTLEGSAAHGFYLAIGEHTLTAMRTAIEGGATLVEGNKLVNVPATGEDKKFAVTIYGIGSDYYLEDITAVAYVKVGDDYTLDVAVTRNIAEVALNALNENETGEILTNVATYISANYKKGYDTYDGRYAIDNAAYCYNPEQLGQLFVRDWNKFVDAEDRIASITSNTKATAASLYYKTHSGADFYYSAKSSKWEDIGGGVEGGVTNISSSNLYLFFNNPAMSAKWGWLLTVMRTAEGDAANAAWQSIAVQGDGTNYNSGKSEYRPLYSGQHLCLSIVGFFTKQKLTYYYTGVDFASAKKSMYNNLYTGSYANTTVYNSFLGEQDIFEIDETISLPSARTPETGYAWVAYELNSVNHAEGSSYTVTDGNVQFAPKFSLINYTVTYYDGDTPLDLSPSTYTVVTDTFSLPNYEKYHYTFDGWYDNPEFNGDPITSIEKGSHINKEFYAKTTETLYDTVNTTFNLNGGSWALEDIIDQNEPTKTVVATYYNSYQGNGYDISFVDSKSTSRWWMYVVLEKTISPNVYRIIGKANGSTALPASYDAVISYHSACTSEYFQAVKDIYNGSNTGQYITVENVPASSGSGKSITIKLFPSTVLNANYVKNMIGPEELPEPYKYGYTFAGWRNSITSVIEDSYPGYYTNPGNITYEAQWNQNVVELNEDDQRVLNLIAKPDIIVYNRKGILGEQEINGENYTVGTDLFTTINAAITSASANDVIFICGGTYSETISVSKSGLKLIGPNYQILGKASRKTAANITGIMTLASNDVEVNGLEFTRNVIVSANGITIDYCYISCTPETAANTITSKKACIVNGVESIENLAIKNSYLMAKGDNSQTTDYIAINNITNLTLRNNYITNNCVSLPGSGLTNDGMVLNYLSGTLNIYDNEFYYATNNWLMRTGLASTADATDAEINVFNNVFSGRGGLVTCTLGFLYMSADSEVTIMNNQFLNCEPSTVSTGAGSSTSSKLVFEYNYISGQKAKIYSTSVTTTNHNCYAGGKVTSGANIINLDNDAVTYANLSEVQAAYAAYLAN